MDWIIIEMAEYTKGAVCYLPQALTNYDAQVYIDPESFWPERWESPTKEMTEAYYISQFLVGSCSRKCPGQALAIAEKFCLAPVVTQI